MKTERYRTPAAFGEAEFTEKRSRFIGRVWPVETEEEALLHLKEMREKHWDMDFQDIDAIPFAETREYVHRVLKHREKYRKLYH